MSWFYLHHFKDSENKKQQKFTGYFVSIRQLAINLISGKTFGGTIICALAESCFFVLPRLIARSYRIIRLQARCDFPKSG